MFKIIAVWQNKTLNLASRMSSSFIVKLLLGPLAARERQRIIPEVSSRSAVSLTTAKDVVQQGLDTPRITQSRVEAGSSVSWNVNQKGLHVNLVTENERGWPNMNNKLRE